MRLVLAPVVLGLTYLSMFLVCRRALRQPFGLIAPIAGAVLISWEALLLNALSAMKLVDPWAILLSHALVTTAVAARGGGQQARDLLRLGRHKIASVRFGWMLVPLLLILVVCAVAFSPSTPDSMAYHMARVAHWIQQRSVGFYPTHNPLQNVMGPGAEYLLVVLQLISGSDLWANCVQLAGYVIIVFATPALCRLAGVPRRLCPWAALLVAALPIGVLEASTTQNDLVAAVVTLALVGASIRFMHRRRRWRGVDVLALGVVAGAGYLTKPTALLAASPFVLWATLVACAGLSVRVVRQQWKTAAATLAVLVALVAPDLSRKLALSDPFLGARFAVYPLVGEWQDRLLNGVRAGCQNLPLPGVIRTVEDILHAPAAQLYCDHAFTPSEDRGGNPLQAGVFLGSMAGALACFGWLGWRERWFALCVPLAWIALHAFIRNQEFITRLQLPVLVLTPLTWAGFTARRVRGSRGRVALLGITSMAALCYGYVIACTNQMKPLSLPGLLNMDRTRHYYLLKPEAYAQHGAVLELLRRTGCSRLGLVTNASSYDYPITWRAMGQGVAVRHVIGPSEWPCAILSDTGRVPDRAVRWLTTAVPGLYVAAAAR